MESGLKAHTRTTPATHVFDPLTHYMDSVGL